MSALVISVMNFKGGVGKTTLTVNLAAGLANSVDAKGNPYKVLVIDSDPQANASVYMLGDYWRKNIYPSPEKSLYGIYDRVMNGSAYGITPEDIIGASTEVKNPIFSIEKRVDPDGKIFYDSASITWSNLHLIPSHYSLANTEKQLKPDSNGKIYTTDSNKSFYYFELMMRMGKYITQHYDYVLIDCPPNLYSVAENSVFLSDYVLIPVVPDWLSTNGINWLIMQLYTIAKKYRKKTKSIQAIVPNLWTSGDINYARHIRILKKSLSMWKKNEKYHDILKDAEVWEGLQRSDSVTKAIDSLRPIVDYQSTEPSRIQLNRMVKQILEWERA